MKTPRSLSEKAMATHSSTLAWTIPWMEESGRLQSMGSHRVRHDWSDLAAAAAAAAGVCIVILPLEHIAHFYLPASFATTDTSNVMESGWLYDPCGRNTCTKCEPAAEISPDLSPSHTSKCSARLNMPHIPLLAILFLPFPFPIAIF